MKIIREILNHSSNTVTTRHYAKPNYLPQMRVAVQSWADRLERIVGNKNIKGNVVQINRGGK